MPSPESTLFATHIETPLGAMTALADEGAVYLLEFQDRSGLETEIARFASKADAQVRPGRPAPAQRLEAELAAYFAGRSLRFATPLQPLGSPFQRSVWAALLAIPPGETRSYRELAAAVGRPRAVRATGAANGANPFAIVVPCHRVIGSNGALTGYAGGIERKRWLLEHERRLANPPSPLGEG